MLIIYVLLFALYILNLFFFHFDVSSESIRQKIENPNQIISLFNSFFFFK